MNRIVSLALSNNNLTLLRRCKLFKEIKFLYVDTRLKSSSETNTTKFTTYS